MIDRRIDFEFTRKCESSRNIRHGAHRPAAEIAVEL
jgi:hypothetical protein